MTEPDVLTVGWIAPPPARPRSRRQKVVIVGLVLVGVLFGTMTLISVLPGNAASYALTATYGSPYNQLPADFRATMETRLKAVLPTEYGVLRNAEQVAWIQDHAKDGQLRLDDATLIRRLRLTAAALGRMPVPPCAALVRHVGDNGGLPAASRDTFLNSLSGPERADWIEIKVTAIEAQVHGAAVQRTVTEDEAAQIRARVAQLATADELSSIRAMGDGTTASDAVTCDGFRALYAIALRLPQLDLATVARYDVQ